MPQLQELGQRAPDSWRGQRVSAAVLVSSSHVAIGFFISLVLSILLVRLSLRYALWRGLLDAPGQRRSHVVATPRGGGLGLLLAALPILAWAWWVATPWLAPWDAVAMMAALLMLMLVGWLDDHRNLPALPRFVLYLLASALLACVVVHDLPGWSPLLRVLAGLGLVLATGWSINAHNFMDGIDGLLGTQMLFYFAALGSLAWYLQAGGVVLSCAGLSAACIGFLFYNRPPARIFMGDVGSVALGWLVAALAALLWRHQPTSVWPALILSSAFIIDASLTLLRRMLRGRRWYTAHREHAYQWLVRSGFSHGQVTLLYLAWNMLLALPLAVAALLWPRLAPGLLALACMVGVIVHTTIRRYCLARHDRRRRGAA